VVSKVVFGMTRKRHSDEDCLKILRQVELDLTGGADVAKACRSAGICAVLDLLAEGRIPQSGFIRQEDVPLSAVLSNRFGNTYSMAGVTQDAMLLEAV
jgi:hypothetical protein